MQGHLDIYTATPDAIVTLAHDNGQSYSAQGVDGHAVVGPFDLPDGNGAVLVVQGVASRGVLWLSQKNPVNGSASFAIDTFPFEWRPAGVARPAARPQKRPVHFLDDPGGMVSQVCPPEQVIPAGHTKDFVRGDGWGVTLAATPPLVPGCNTTPREMVFAYFLCKYPRLWQDVILTEHCWRWYSHFLQDLYTALLTGLSPTQFVELIRYVQSWGFWTPVWALSTDYRINFKNWAQAAPILQPFLDALIAAGPDVCDKTILIIGEELNACTSPEGLDSICVGLKQQCDDHGIERALHFTLKYPAWPIGAESKPDFWRRMRSHNVNTLYYQADAAAPTGTIMAEMFDARGYMAEADAEHLRLTFFEGVANEQLYHGDTKYTEEYGCGVGLAAVYATRHAGSNMPAVAGYGNGGRLPDGSPL